MKPLLLLFLLVFFALVGTAQIAPGNWDVHLSMNKTFKVVDGGNKIFFLSQGGIFSFNKTDNSIEQITRLDGLSGADFATMSYNPTVKALIVAYNSSCIDIIKNDGSIIPITDIKRKYIPGDKAIYNIYNEGDLCYLSCGFGIVVLDAKKHEIKDTYRIGDNGDNLKVNDLVIANNNIYAATADGIKWAPLSGLNLLDYSTWTLMEDKDLPNLEFHFIEYDNNNLFVVHKSEEWHGDRTFVLTNKWNRVYRQAEEIYDFQVHGDTVIYATHNGIEIYDFGEQSELLKINEYSFVDEDLKIHPNSVLVQENNVWIADYNYGAVHLSGSMVERILPNGPVDNSIFKLSFSDGKLWVTKGGFNKTWTNTWQSPLIQTFENGKWEYFDKEKLNVSKELLDAYLIVPFPGDPNHFYVSFYGYSLMEIQNGEVVNWFNAQNSTLKPVYADAIRVGGMGFDRNRNLWVSNGLVEKNLHKLSPDGKWTAYTLPEIANDYNVGKVLVTKNQDIWMVVPRGVTNGLYVMSNDGALKTHLNVLSYFSNGEEEIISSMNKVYDIIEDNNGEIWVATDKGVTTYRNPRQVFDTNPYYAYQPGLDRNDGIYHALLENETVTCIVIDGANRKWCGTSTSGVFLISEDGETELAHLNINNSPMLTNTITSLAYNEKEGTLYIGSDVGLVSYRTDSKGGFNNFDQIYAYPNPVRENYNGDIYISGLISDTNVKITTIAGRLVYETTSFGGQAVWDGKDLAGNRVHTGIYMVFCANDDGTESAVTKILFIR